VAVSACFDSAYLKHYLRTSATQRACLQGLLPFERLGSIQTPIETNGRQKNGYCPPAKNKARQASGDTSKRAKYLMSHLQQLAQFRAHQQRKGRAKKIPQRLAGRLHGNVNIFRTSKTVALPFPPEMRIESCSQSADSFGKTSSVWPEQRWGLLARITVLLQPPSYVFVLTNPL
jgi:hypothetical protein